MSIAAAAALSLLQGMAQAQDASDGGTLQSITVTAERRETVLLKSPESITALSGAALKTRGLVSLDDLNGSIPNYTFTSNEGVAQIFIRGIGNNFITLGGDPGVAFHTDGSYVSDQTATNTGLFDVQRVEVLRGPQGALYGRNATGGAINVISNAPTGKFSAQAGALIGNYGRAETEGFVSGGLGAAGMEGRASWQIKRYEGHTRNRLAGQAASPDAPSRLDDLASEALRLQVRKQLNEASRIRLIVSHFNESDAGSANTTLAEVGPTPAFLLYGAVPTGSEREAKSQAAYNRRRVSSVQAILEQSLGSADLTVLASHRRAQQRLRADCDGTEASVCDQAFDTRSRESSLDAYVAFDAAGSLRGLVGATAMRYTQAQDISVGFQVPLGFLVPAAPLNVPFPGTFLQGGEVTTTAYSLYGDVRYAISPVWALTAGARVSRDRKDSSEYQTAKAFGIDGRGALSGSWNSTPAKLGIEGQLDAQSLVYARAARGFKAGAINVGALQGAPVRPETVSSVEVGLKTSFFAKRGQFGAALFTSKYRDLQVIQIVGVGTALQNAASASIRGAELELALRPVAALTLNGNVGWLDGQYRDFSSINQRAAPTGPAVNLAGKRLANTSRLQAAFGVQVDTALAGQQASMRADYAWRDKIYFNEFNTEDVSQKAYGLLNLSVTLSPLRGSGSWKTYAWLKNATDVKALASMQVVSPLLGATRTANYVPPRQLGVGATLDF